MEATQSHPCQRTDYHEPHDFCPGREPAPTRTVRTAWSDRAPAANRLWFERTPGNAEAVDLAFNLPRVSPREAHAEVYRQSLLTRRFPAGVADHMAAGFTAGWDAAVDHMIRMTDHIVADPEVDREPGL